MVEWDINLEKTWFSQTSVLPVEPFSRNVQEMEGIFDKTLHEIESSTVELSR